MATSKTFAFQSGDDSILRPSVSELISNSKGLSFTWPSALVLSAYLIVHDELVTKKVVLELGAGTGLVSVIAGLLGASKVTATDRDQESTLTNLEATFAMNEEIVRKTCSACAFDWSQSYRGLPWDHGFDIIVAADIFYSTEDFDDILLTISRLLDKSGPSCSLITAYQERSIHRSLAVYLEKYHLTARSLESPLHGAHAEGGTVMMIMKERDDAGAEVQEPVNLRPFDNIYLLEIRRK